MATKKDPEKLSGEPGDNCGGGHTQLGSSKLGRRALSFKEDFIDKISSFRSPGRMRSGSRSNSPRLKCRHRSRSPKPLTSAVRSYDSGLDNPSKDLEDQLKQMQTALRYFQNVIFKNRLEMLPGNSTIVLETVANIHSILKSYAMDEQNSTLVSSQNQMYQSLAQLLKLCDDLLIVREKTLNKEKFVEAVNLMENAVQNLVCVVSDKVTERENCRIQSESCTSSRSTVSSDQSHYRISLPEITVTSRERQLLEQSTQSVMERYIGSRPTPQLLQEKPSSPQQPPLQPPPKPPLPDKWLIENAPPPLPPKKRNLSAHVTNSMPLVPASLSLEKLSLKSNNSSVTSFDYSSNGVRMEFPNDECTSRPVSLERIFSSSSGVFMSNSSSHYEVEHQQPQTQEMDASASFSTIECMALTTSHIRLTTTNSVMGSFTMQKEDENPPALPAKMRKMFLPDNPFGTASDRSSYTDVRYNNGHSSEDYNPPPLPLKKKHIMAYMEMFGNCSHSNTEFLQRSVDTYNMLQAEWQKHEIMLNSTQSCSFDLYHSSSPNHSNVLLESSSAVPPALPPRRGQLSSDASSQSPNTSLTPMSPVLPVLPSYAASFDFEETAKSPSISGSVSRDFVNGGAYIGDQVIETEAPQPLNELDVTQWLIFKRPGEDGPGLRGGDPDALIVLATKANKNDFLYQEAFLTTYRTFVTPLKLIQKLIYRYQRFDIPWDPIRQKTTKETFSLLIRVIGDLTIMDLDEHVVESLTAFIYQLIRNGNLLMGKTLRKKWLERYQAKLQFFSDKISNESLASQNIYIRQSSLLDFKSEHIAEQMTLLDADLFYSIEIPEVLMWTQEQNEEKSPNLTRFTEHFNKMSFWVRTRILEQNDPKDRERYVTKFIKIMKYLRKVNNFNSYLALLAALDSAPIRRLEWQKHITDGLKEYCALIDSSSSFRAYRQALAETQPPCIPYIGLVLQDLTFVHVGNNDFVCEDSMINFSKRWQQFNIVENMKRFKKVTYNFKSHGRILAFFNNFDEFLCEEAMWQLSECIKPRGTKKPVTM